MTLLEQVRQSPKVREAYAEHDDGETTYWVHLNAGWSSPMDPGALHTIHERRMTDVAAQVRRAPKCSCEDCVKALVTKD
jgi:hypothetical protein